MLKKILLIVTIISFFSCKKEQIEGFKITGKTDSFITGSTARVFRIENKKKKVLDSSILDNGNFILEGKTVSPDKYYISIDNVLGVFPLILTSESFEIEVITDSIESSKITGSDANAVIEKYTKGSQYLKDTHLKLREKFNTFRLKDDKDGMQSIKNDYDSLVLESVRYDVSFLKEYPNTVLSALNLERITMAKQITDEEAKILFNTLSKDMQETRAAKHALEFIAEQNAKQ